MRTFACILIFTIFSLKAHSEGIINIGIKYGTNSSVMHTNFDEILEQNMNQTNMNNYFAGAFTRINIGRLYIQPEAYFNTKGGIIAPVNITETLIPSKTTFKYQTIDVPVLAGYKIIKRDMANVRINAGPVFSYITANALISELNNLQRSHLNNRYIGWQIGLGIDIWFISIDGRIENSTNILTSESPFVAKNQSYLLSVGIKLF